MKRRILTAFLLMLSLGFAADEPRTVRVFVALADNASQGIAPVPAKIGNGDDADANLYWGTSEGFRSIFRASKSWTRTDSAKPEAGPVLERLAFTHASRTCVLTAEAWRGSEIKACLEAFFQELKTGSADLVVFVGHNGLMDFHLPVVVGNQRKTRPEAMVLCCKSRAYFSSYFEALEVKPLLLTEQLMYPGSFLVRDTLAVWLQRGSLDEIRMAAAKSYAANQGISVKAAAGVFSKLK